MSSLGRDSGESFQELELDVTRVNDRQIALSKNGDLIADPMFWKLSSIDETLGKVPE